MKFLDEHQDQRDQYEIVTVHFGSEEGFDPILKSLEEKKWQRKFSLPILFDGKYDIFRRWGVSELGTMVLIDPEGKIAEIDHRKAIERLETEVGS